MDSRASIPLVTQTSKAILATEASEKLKSQMTITHLTELSREEQSTTCDKVRSSYFQKTKNHDYIVYDARCEIMEFKDRYTHTIQPVKFYSDIDLDEARHNYKVGLGLEPQDVTTGLNEVSY